MVGSDQETFPAKSAATQWYLWRLPANSWV